MAVSTRTLTHGLLSGWADYMHVSPWHFNQIAGDGIDAPINDLDNAVYVQPEREYVATAAAQALAQGLKVTRFYPQPTWYKELIPLNPRYRRSRQSLLTRYGYLQTIGKRATTLISAGATVTYSDTDGDGIDDTGTITVSTSVTDVSEVQAFFRAADSLSTAANPLWQIEPLFVSISGGTATISGHRALFAKPSLWRAPYRQPNYDQSSKNAGSTTDAADFVTTVDVYRVYSTQTDAVTLRANPYGVTTDPTTWESYQATAVIEDTRLGVINCDVTSTVDLTAMPCYLEVWYKSGHPLDEWTQRMDTALQAAFARLTNTLFPYQPPNGDPRLYTQDNDDAKNTEVFLPSILFNNPLGTKTGAVEAFKDLKSMALSYPPMVV